MQLLPAGLPSPAAGGFTTRTGGVSTAPYLSLNLGLHVADDPDRVQTNRERAASAVGLPVEALVFAAQVHGPAVAVVDAAVSGVAVSGVDGLVTTTPGLCLVVLAADCLPVLLADPAAGVVAAAHAGRAGLAAGILQETIAAMVRLGATAAGTTAVLGPAACGRCYELPTSLADQVGMAVPGSRSTTRQGTAGVDLAQGAAGLLAAAGVARIRAVGGCTIEQPETFFSYRRDGITGRHGALVQLS